MARGSMSNLDVRAWVSRAEALDCWVDNVYGDPQVFYLKLRCRSGLSVLAVEPSVRAHFTKRAYPDRVEGFVVMLRKLLRDRRVTGVSQLGFDRVVSLEFTGGYRLYVELLPRGVAALADDSGVVKALSRSLKTRDREVYVGSEYRPPPLQQVNPFELSADAIATALRGGRDAVRGLVRGLGLPGEVAEEALSRSGIPPSSSPESLSSSELERLVGALREIYAESLEGRGYLVVEEGEPREATPFKPRRVPEDRVRAYATLDEALDELFSSRVRDSGDELAQERARLESSLREAESLAERYAEEARRLREAAEKLAMSYGVAEEVVECVERNWRLRLSDKCSGVSRVDYGSGVYVFEIDGLEYVARYGESPQSIIVRLYREAGEAESKAEKARRARAEAESRLRELETRARIRAIQARSRARGIAWFERFRWTITTNGFLVIAGRDASQNEVVVRKYMEDDDVFMHADIHGAPAVVIKTRGGEPSTEDLEDAGVLAACYSRAWKAGYSAIEVFWARGSQVSKSPPPGEYIKTGSFMVYGRREYFTVKLSLAVGVSLTPENTPIILAGSERVVSRYSLAYAILAPGKRGVDETEAVKNALAEVLPEEDRVYALAVEDRAVRDALPGGFTIVRSSRGAGEVLDLRLYA